MNLPQIWIERSNFLQKYRERMWNELSQPNIKPEWIITRPKLNQWSIDEVLRHMLGSEVRYIQQSLDSDISQHTAVVPDQWVGTVFFRLEEREHLELPELLDIFPAVENKSLQLLENVTEKELQMIVEAPWKEQMSFHQLLEWFYAHEHYHRGQVHFLITYYRGPPTFQNRSKSN